MLVLSRKVGERIRIGPLPGGGYVWVEVVEVRGAQVRLGIDCPLSIDVRREELLPEADRYGAERGRST